MWIQVSPFASVLDAESVLPRIQENNFRRNPRAEVTVVEERKIEDQEIAGIANPWVFEQLSTGSRGPMASRYVAGTF